MAVCSKYIKSDKLKIVIRFPITKSTIFYVSILYLHCPCPILSFRSDNKAETGPRDKGSIRPYVSDYC